MSWALPNIAGWVGADTVGVLLATGIWQQEELALAIDIGTLILVESALSYLGLGVTPPTPSWGNMLNNAQSFFERGPPLVFMRSRNPWVRLRLMFDG